MGEVLQYTILVMVVITCVLAIVALIMTSVFSNKKGAIDKLNDEKAFLNILSGSTTCVCSTTTPTTTTAK